MRGMRPPTAGRYDPSPVAVTEGANGASDSYVATYHDTADRRLTRANIVLRRRMEDGVGVWEAEIAGHLVSAPGGPVDVPDEIARALVAPLRGADVVEIARLRTDDRVALLEGAHVLRSDDDEQGALHDTLDRRRAPKRREPALAHVQAYLGAQLAEIERNDPVVRIDPDVEALHDLRVAVRRTRAVLRAARDLFDGEWVDRLRDELKWLGGELGPARDLDVLILHLREERKEVGSEATPIIRRLERERRGARRRAVTALNNDRYLALLDELHVAVEHPPVQTADVRLARVAAREYEKLRRDVAALGPEPTDDALHRARIRGKRARYAAELAEPIAGKRAGKFVKAAKQFQDVIGEHQDAIVAEQRIRAFAESADAAFGAGRLVERQRARRARARAAVPAAWKRLQRRGRRAWA
jgi:CHAD domain-containing protein